MGEVLKVLNKVKIGDEDFLIEQNAPLVKGGSKVIHLQNEKFRMEIPEQTFLKIAGAIAYSRKRFDVLKGSEMT